MPCCSRYKIITETTSDSNQTAAMRNCTCHLTLSELIELSISSSTEENECPNIELLFQSGVHLVKGYKTHLMMPLSIHNKNNLLIQFRGEPNTNTIVKCCNSDQPFFNFTDVLSIKLQYIYIEKCKTEFGGSEVLINIKNILFTKVEIADSIFIDSGITLYANIEYSASAIMIIEDTTIANYSRLQFNSPTFLNVDSYYSLSFNIELKNLNFSYNDQSFLFILSTRIEPFVIITGINYFIHNKYSIITLQSYGTKVCRIHFLTAEVHF